MRLAPSLLVVAALLSGATRAQVNLVDPDAPRPSSTRQAPRAPEGEAADAPDAELLPTPAESNPADGQLRVPVGKPRAVKPGEDKAKKEKEPVKVEAPARAEPPKMVVQTVSDADLDQVWAAWREANAQAAKRPEVEKAARQALLRHKALLDASNLELWAVGLLRAAEAWEAQGDSGAAAEIAATASQLAPELPATWFMLARIYAQIDPSGVGRVVDALSKGLAAQLADPRYLRPLLASGAAAVLIALVLTAIAVLGVLLLRRGYYFLYDFHFFFPRAAARWQTALLAVLVLALPIVFRMGVVPTLLGFFAAVTLYLTRAERIVAAVLLGLVGLVPVAGALVAERTAFADTEAEDLYLLDRGGPGLEALAARYETLAAEEKVGFTERFVVGRFHLNRGHLEPAVAHLRHALTLRPDDAPARLALAKAYFLQGDLENSRTMLEAVKKDAPSAVALFDLGRVYLRRVATLGESVVGEVDRANANLVEARALDATLPSIDEEAAQPKDIVGNEYLRTLPAARADLLALARDEEAGPRVRSQLTQMLLGDVNAAVAPFYPAVVALLLLGFGLLGPSLSAAKACNRCGRAVSRRGDPEVSAGSQMCTQCVNVFARKNVVAPSVKVRKQLEVARYESRLEKVSTVLALVWSGMGHVFAGAPGRGAVWGFFFVLAITGGVLRGGVLRAPYEGVPPALVLGPLAVLFLVVYLVSFLRLRRRQG